MRESFLSVPRLCLAATVLSATVFVARADEAPAGGAAPAGPALSFNVGAISEYRYRGIAQSRFDPALQGGADYGAASGLYVGTWLSTIRWIKDAGTLNGVDTGSTPLEWDLYGGYKGELTPGLGFDVGGLAYVYPNNRFGRVSGGSDANTFELYGALVVGVVSAKYSVALTDLFGNADTKGSGYLDLSAAFDLGQGWSLTPHVGRQEVRHLGAASYTDYALTLAKDFGGGLSASAAAIGTDASKAIYVAPDGRFLGRTALVVGLKASF